ncbi:hypothetical protein KHP60_23395 [Microvirga sp. 3-52]|uniref:hypothetical protein n=1 Tax=Microvirga sp. 3-52 TaxID=2792425 RepID=UPI001AC26B39|nr:hypothetical protein [Microvirga sp. 3-52]MBO1908456.1 hypothetical protein [Microvirga sp. 3-52]MBS7455244.1 hypothetical protein [Microvirga sp. 3-52]
MEAPLRYHLPIDRSFEPNGPFQYLLARTAQSCGTVEKAPAKLSLSLRKNDAPPGKFLLLGIEVSLKPNVRLSDQYTSL